MASFNSVFQRKEKKYHLSAAQHRAMLRALEGRMEVDEYGRTPIVSFYLDTPERFLIDRSLEKPLYKEKLRIRSYGDPDENTRVFVEIKKKFKGIVYKRRVGMTYAAAQAYLSGVPYSQACSCYPLPDPEQQAEAFGYRACQIAREIDAFVQRRAPLAPSMEIRVMRTAYRIPVDGADADDSGAAASVDSALSGQGDLRITFDEEITYRDLTSAHAAAMPLVAAGDVVMEIKSTGPYPLWLTQALSAVGAYPESFSKYGRAYVATEGGGETTQSAVARTAAADDAAAHAADVAHAADAAAAVPRRRFVGGTFASDRGASDRGASARGVSARNASARGTAPRGTGTRGTAPRGTRNGRSTRGARVADDIAVGRSPAGGIEGRGSADRPYRNIQEKEKISA